MKGKAAFNFSDNPLFIDALTLTIFLILPEVKCSLFLIILNDNFKASNTSCFLVINGYFSK